MTRSLKHLTGALLIALLILPAAAQEEPDTTKTGKAVEVEVEYSADGRYTIIRNGEVIEMGRTGEGEMIAPSINIKSLDSLLADTGIRLEQNGNEIVIYGEGGEIIRTHTISIDDGSITIFGDRPRSRRRAVFMSRHGGERRRSMDRRAEIDDEFVAPRIERIGPVTIRRHRGWDEDETIERHVEIDGDTAVVLIERHGPVEIRTRRRQGAPDDLVIHMDSMLTEFATGQRARALAISTMRRGIEQRIRRARHNMRGHRDWHDHWPARRARQGEHSEELRELETEARRLARAVREANDEDRAEHMEALREHLGKIFARKLRLEARSIEEARERLRERSGTIEQRRENRDQIIEDRLNQLLGRGSAYRW